MASFLSEVIKNFKQYPGIESVCTSFGTDAYSNKTMFQGYHIDGDTTNILELIYVMLMLSTLRLSRIQCYIVYIKT